jgi:hypothetical protein
MNNKNACLLACWLIIACLVTPPTGLAQSTRFYPSAKHGGNYLYNYYFPPAPSTTPWRTRSDAALVRIVPVGLLKRHRDNLFIVSRDDVAVCVCRMRPIHRAQFAAVPRIGSGFDQLGSADFLIALRG